METKEIFADRFKALRLERSMNQVEFAAFLGVSRPTIGFYENAERQPDATTIAKIAKKCEVSSDYLLGLTDVKSADIDIQAACNRFELSEEALKLLESTKGNVVKDGLRLSFPNFNRLIDFLICNMSWMDIDGWYEAFHAIKSHKHTNEIELLPQAEDRIRSDNTMVVDLDDAKALYAQMIAHHVLTVLLGEQDPNGGVSRFGKVVDAFREILDKKPKGRPNHAQKETRQR